MIVESEEIERLILCTCSHPLLVTVPEENRRVPRQVCCPKCRQRFDLQWIAAELTHSGSEKPERELTNVIAVEPDGQFTGVVWSGKTWWSDGKEAKVHRWFEIPRPANWLRDPRTASAAIARSVVQALARREGFCPTNSTSPRHSLLGHITRGKLVQADDLKPVLHFFSDQRNVLASINPANKCEVVGDIQEDVPRHLQAVFMLEEIRLIATIPHSRQSNGWRHVQQQEKVGLWGKFSVVRQYPARISPPRALISSGGEVVAIEHHHSAFF